MTAKELEYGPVFVFGGRFKGRVMYYDDDDRKHSICYAGHPHDFAGYYLVPSRFIREVTVDDLMKRRGTIWKQITDQAMHNSWELEPEELHELWSEKSLIDNELFERRLFGEFGQLDGTIEVFLCHSSSDKGYVRMVHDDLKRLRVKCWLDENNIKVGDSIVSKISDGLTSSKVMIVFLSKSSTQSLWAAKEWQSFLSRQLSNIQIKLLPVLLEDCDIPTILSDIKYADFRESYHNGFKEIYNAIK